MDQYQATVITSLLHGLVADKTQLYCSDRAERTLFWAAPLSSANAQRVESDPNVRFWALAIHECALTDDFRSLRLSKSKNRLRTAMTLLIVDSESLTTCHSMWCRGPNPKFKYEEERGHVP